uniref:TPR_REGION domain-containing protein n=1 Tax=Panagrellus redivivus TaxID=6233 RepID=A0A7E4VDE6_PANRE
MSASNEPPRVVKKILASGRGQLPAFEKDDKAIVDYEVFVPKVEPGPNQPMPESLDDYRSVDSTRKAFPHGFGQPLELVIGKQFNWTMFETCVRTMLVNEIAQFDMQMRDASPFPLTVARLRDAANPCKEKKHVHRCAAMGTAATGYEELDEYIQNPTPVRVIINLKNYISANDYTAERWQLNNEQRLECVGSYREEGNRLFKEKQYDAAKEKYREALTILDTLILNEKPGDPEWIELDQKNLPLYLNLSQCYLNLGNYYEAIGATEEALKRDPTNEKGLFRKAKGLIAVWDLDTAEECLQTLRSEHPSSEAVVAKELELLAAKRVEKLASDKNVYKAMFGKK